MPPYARTDGALRGAAQLIRKLHRAAARFRPAITSYRFHRYPPATREIISHGDLGPRNTVYRDGMPVGFIDWDTTQPVDPLADLPAAAWTFGPLAPPDQHAACGSGRSRQPSWPGRPARPAGLPAAAGTGASARPACPPRLSARRISSSGAAKEARADGRAPTRSADTDREAATGTHHGP